MNQLYNIKPETARERRRSHGKSSYVGTVAMVLVVVIGIGSVRAATPSPSETDAAAIAFHCRCAALRGPSSTETDASANQTPESVDDPMLTHAWTLTTRAYASHSLADYCAATDALEKCSHLHPQDLLLHRALGDIYLNKLNQPNLAYSHLQAVYKATPDAPGWGQMLAQDAGEIGRPDVQIQVLSEVAKRESQDPWCRIDLAKALTSCGRFAEADQAFQDAIKIVPTEEWVNLAYAQFLKSQGRNSEAERIAQKVLATHPKSAAAMTLLGDIYQDNSDFTGAKAEYSRAMLTDPTYSEAKAGLNEVQKSQSPQLKTSGYVFQGTDHFSQSAVYNTLTTPLLDHLFVNTTFNTGWYGNSESRLPNTTRYEEGLGLEYRFNSTLSIDAGASGFEVGDHNVVGFNLATTWKPNRDFWMFGSFHLDDPVNDSINTVVDGLSQDVVAIGSGYQFNDDLSATVTASQAYYSDGNTKTFIHAEPITYMIWRPAQLRIGPVYETIDYHIETPNYSSPSWYQTYGPMIEAEPSLCKWLSIKARYEATYINDSSKWGTILAAGPSIHLNNRLESTAEYLYYDVPGSLTNYSGNGFRAVLSYRF